MLWEDEKSRCDSCPLVALESALACEKGQRLQTAQEICMALDAGFSVNWQELAADQFVAVVLLKSELVKLQEEQSGKQNASEQHPPVSG